MLVNHKNVQFLTRKFINHLMVDGKKEKAEIIFRKVLKLLSAKENKEGLLVFFQALENTKPFVELRSVRRGGATYQVPVPIYEKRSLSLSMKWLIEICRKKKGSFVHNFTQILLEASKGSGDSIKRRETLHTNALKNRSFTHLWWF